MQQILILIGISGSGKSTFAKQFCAENSNWLRVNRDGLRKSMLAVSLNEYWRAENNFIQRTESLVNEVHNAAIKTALRKDWNILIDNTHIKLAYINQIIKLVSDFKVEIRFKLMDTPLEECIERDKNRADQVGETVIREQFEKLQILKKSFNIEQVITITPSKKESAVMVQDETLPKCVIVDIDGTVADKGNRIAYEWSKVGEDIPKLNIIRLVKILKSEGYEIIFFSGRDAVCRPQTLEWLCQHFEWQPTHFQLYMRNENDNRKDSLIKKELFEAQVKDKYFVDFVIDDRNQVVDMWRMELGLVCLQVDYGDF
jgi:predicted kinase